MGEAARNESISAGDESTNQDQLAHELEAIHASNETDERIPYRQLDGAFSRSGESLRARYVNLTANLIHEIEASHADTVIFLDKSARPVEWLVEEFWDLFAERHGDKTVPPEKPEMKFINIDREPFRPYLGGIEDEASGGMIHLNDLPQEYIDNLRRAFARPEGASGDRSDQSYLDGKRVMVVDEVKATGDTLRFAAAMMKKAFPEADMSWAWWMRPVVVAGRDGVAKPVEVPVWYTDAQPEGRGVVDPVSPKHFLSRAPQSPDGLALQLRQEIHQLGKDVRSGAQRFAPSPHQDAESWSPELSTLVAEMKQRRGSQEQ
jgi:hypothetical protein